MGKVRGSWSKTQTDVFVPLVGVSMLIQVIQNWKKNKEVAKVSLFAAILAFGVSIFKFVIR
ncbi:hypothetical protein K2F40_16735 [Clostridium sp. CM028]|uniref:hypothetical protein n=1 Tax=unclassified Clostridium TaxID=2614128 RepID=UPI001C0BC7E9|nr:MULTISPECIES: hypothetical protein [unclassified Clostridium]MBU3093916.1 hypothetical protein [Clostridium sp. CF011]MBW9147320.1 hypothetical protein [Clostridium sp. CM027]MBW9150577.1 hypothetical protein [Clostridium sp. CM028]UVE42190.1 hypothetical protein KTC92_07020 [Clostridium sp. CM027]WAG71214.1 hypothetical protein LL036_07320 [Clostridium sp. CF011]